MYIQQSMRAGGDRGPSTSDSDSAQGQHNNQQIRQIANLKLKMRPSSRQNFKISRPQSRQAQQRRLSPREINSPKKKNFSEKSGTESGTGHRSDDY